MKVEEYSHLEFDFGQSEAKIEEIENLISQFKKFPLAFPEQTKQKCLAKIEVKQEQPLAIMDQVMADASASTSTSLPFGISGSNRLISQLPDQPMLNIQCQHMKEIREAIHLLSNWVTYKKTQDASLTPQYLAIHLVMGFARLAFEW